MNTRRPIAPAAPAVRPPAPLARAVLAGLAALLTATPAVAATWTWTGAAGNNSWNNSGNWNPVVQPANDGTADVSFGGVNRLTPDLTLPWNVNSVSFLSGAGQFNLFSTLGNTLTVGAGGITNLDNDIQNISHALTLAAPQTWTAVAGGLSVAGVGTGGNLLTVNVGGNAGVVVNVGGALTGSGGLTKTGAGDLILAGSVPNAFTGTTAVTDGKLVLNKGGGANAIGGTVNVGVGTGFVSGTLRNDASNQVADTATVSVLPTGTWILNNGASESIQNLNAVSNGTGGGGRVTFVGAGTLTVLGTMTMTGGVTVGGRVTLAGGLATNASDESAQVASPLDLGGGTRVVNVAAGTVPYGYDLALEDVVSNGGLVKAGPGVLWLNHANTYALGTTLNAGTLLIGNDSALGTGPLTVNGGTLRGDGPPRTVANAVVLAAAATVDGGAGLTLTGPVSGPGGLTKTGSGSLTLAGSAANTYAGATTVNGGALSLDGDGTMIPGTLNIGDGVGTNLDVVYQLRGGQIVQGATVNVFATGLWFKDGVTAFQTITNLNIVSTGVPGGGRVSRGTSLINLLGNLTMTGGTITGEVGSFGLSIAGHVTTNASSLPATMEGTVSLPAGAHTFTVADGAAPVDLDVRDVIKNDGQGVGGLVKAGLGTLRLGGPNTYSGGTTLTAGTILIGHDSALGTGPLTGGGGTLRADGAARTIANAVTGSFAVDGPFDLTFGSPQVAAGVVTKNGPATLVFAQPATFGSLTLNAGTARIDAGATVAGGLTNGATLDVGAQTLTVHGAGLANGGYLTLAGGTLTGTGPVVNNGLIAGHGTIGGTGGFTNNAQVTVDAGSLTIARAGPNANAGNVAVSVAQQLRLTGGALTNTGTISLVYGTVAGTATLTNNPGGTVGGRGLISAPFANAGGTVRVFDGTLNVTNAFASSGVIRLQDGAGLAGGAIANTGRIQGDGSVANAVANAGEIEPIGTLVLGGTLTNNGAGLITVGTGNRLVVTAGLATNGGTIGLAGGTFSNNGAPLNNAGQISGFGTLSTGGLTNNGSVTFTGGFTVINGAFANAATKRVAVLYNPALFNGAVTNAGTFQVTATTVTFAGGFNGTPPAAPAPDAPAGPVPAAPPAQAGATVIESGGQIVTSFVRQNSLAIEGSMIIRA